MQTVDMSKCVEGTFIQELKNRFLCEVLISNISTVCYVPSSCHLSNFLSLQGKKVLLIPTAAPKARTRFALFAIPYKRNYIILNTSMANRAMENSLQSRQFSFLGRRRTILAEHHIEGYKADLYIEDTKTIIEVKSVLSVDEHAIFPTVYSERSLSQIKRLKAFLQQGYRVHYDIVSLNPYVKGIVINSDTAYGQLIKDCNTIGMTFFAHSCYYSNGLVILKKRLPITFS